MGVGGGKEVARRGREMHIGQILNGQDSWMRKQSLPAAAQPGKEGCSEIPVLLATPTALTIILF